MSDDPIAKFHQWWEAVIRDVQPKHRGAMCLSTVADNGMPSARFVALKTADARGFLFCTWFNSRKGQELARHPHAALTFWWEEKGWQVRVEGVIAPVSAQESDAAWHDRSRDAQLTTVCFQQSQPLATEAELEVRLQQARQQYEGQPVPRPAQWGGLRVMPQSLEFLTFRDNRLHLREYFSRATPQSDWEKRLLQP